MKKLLAMLLAVLLLTGCQLAVEEKQDSGLEDKLVGVFVTFDRLDLDFDIEGWLNDNPGALKGEEITLEHGAEKEYGQRLWAQVSGDGWAFPGHEGLYMGQMWKDDHWVGFSTEGFCEMKTHHDSTQTRYSIEEEGTICFPEGSEVMLCANPVYMTPEGTYYAIQGDSFHSMLDGGSMSQSISDEMTWNTEDGETSYCAKFTTTVRSVRLAQQVTVVHMSAEHRELKREEYIPGEMPESIGTDGAYLIVEEISGESAGRKLYQPGDEQIAVYYRGGEPWCLPEFVQILWNE